LTTEASLATGSGGPVGKGGPIGETLTAPRKTAIETLSTTPIEKDSWGKKGGPFSMEGPLKYRRIKVMQMPPYPRWAEEKGIEATVSFRLWVDPKGKVRPEKVYLEKTSGYSELDAAAKDSLIKFVFVPIPDGQPAEDEWGVATFKFELKK
jgi:TonB family protein